MLFAALKDKKNSHDDNEGKSAFHAIAIELYKQKKNKQKENIYQGRCSFKSTRAIDCCLASVLIPYILFAPYLSVTILTFDW